MTKGVVLFAHNNQSVDYIGLAVKSAKRIKEYLGLPVSLITDSSEWLTQQYPDDVYLFDKIISTLDNTVQQKRFYDGSVHYELIPWKNTTRSTVYDLTPYDETLVIDVDYILNSNHLLSFFELGQDFVLFKDSVDLSGWRQSAEFKYIENSSVPFYWATVFYFKKTAATRILFDLISFIKNNWNYYRLIYNINSSLFRNDYAFSIAIHMLNGFTCEKFAGTAPSKMYFTLDKDILIKQERTSSTFLIEKQHSLGQYTLLKTDNLDVHVMNKQSIIRTL